MTSELQNKTVKGAAWIFANGLSQQLAFFIISTTLARLLTPDAYGIVGLANVAIALVSCFGNLGLGGAIIQKKEVDEFDYNTFFWADCMIRVGVYVIVYLIAPLFARFYKHPELVIIIRIIAIPTLLGIFTSVSGLILTRRLNFKAPAIISFISSVVSGCVAIVLAYRGYGVWALIWNGIISTSIGIPLFQYVAPWRPRLIFLKQRLSELLNFGYKLFLSGIVSTIYNNISSLIIGKAYSVTDLGYYSKGNNISQMVMSTLNGPINGVAFPFVLFFYGEKWLFAVPYMQIMAIAYIFYPIHSLNLGVLTGLGRTDLFLKLEIYKKVISLCYAVMHSFWDNSICLESCD